jgi:MFS family permease
LIVAATGSGILIFVLLTATSALGVICFAVFYGFFSGAFISLLPAGITSLSAHVGEVGVRMGIAWAVIALAALTGTPIDGCVPLYFFLVRNEADVKHSALLGDSVESPQWWRPVTFSGVSILVGAIIVAVARTMHARDKGSARV